MRGDDHRRRWIAATSRPPRRARAGFTLLEVIASFAILSLMTLVILRGVVAAGGATVHASDIAAAERVAHTLLDSPLALAPDARLTGTLDDRAYTVTASPLPFAPAATKGAQFTPLRVRISVAAGAGRTVEVETVRIVGAPS